MSQPTVYEATETKDLDYFSTLPFMSKTSAQREDNKLERQARMHFAVFVDMHISKDILDGSTVESQNKLDSFVHELRSHMLKLHN